jgi:hypothetical protein
MKTTARHGLWIRHGKNRALLYRQWDVISRCATRSVRLYRVPLTVGNWNRVCRLIAARMHAAHRAYQAAAFDLWPDEMQMVWPDEQPYNRGTRVPRHPTPPIPMQWHEKRMAYYLQWVNDPARMERTKAYESLAEATETRRVLSAAITAAKAALKTKERQRNEHHQDETRRVARFVV